jgi:hypothetical protein
LTEDAKVLGLEDMVERLLKATKGPFYTTNLTALVLNAQRKV